MLTINSTGSNYTCRIVGYKLCRIDAEKGHTECYGLSFAGEKASIVPFLPNDNIKYTILHELTHNLTGNDHEDCTEGQDCVLQRYYDGWCDSCTAAFVELYD